MDLDSRWLYLGLVLLVAGERLIELRIANRHARQLTARGGREIGHESYRVMVLLHTAWLVACPLEVWLARRPLLPQLALFALGLLIATMALRYWVIATLGERWTTRVYIVPDERVVTSGPYRWLRHPNYLAVVLEILALPLVHSAWASAILFTLANALILRQRIKIEERALADHSDYGERFADLPRLVPQSRYGKEP